MAKVIGASKLRTKYESHEAKRALCNAYDLFLADERVLPSLSQLLGELSASLKVLMHGSVNIFSSSNSDAS